MVTIHDLWMHELIDSSLIESFDINEEIFLRLKGSCEFILAGEKTRELTREYESGYEKGGLLLTSIKKIKQKTVLTVDKIVFVPNISQTPQNCYCPEPLIMQEIMDHAFLARRLPLIFHTHPTKSFNLIEEVKQYHFQMDTSLMDRRTSLYSHLFKVGNLRLPEVLVIGNGSFKQGLFVGLYGGLIAPLSFKNRKTHILLDWCFQQAANIFESIDTTEKKIFAFGLTMVAAKLIASNPPRARDIVKEASGIFPGLIYASASENCFFGLTYASKLKISLPKLDDEFIKKEENLIRNNKEFYHKKTLI